MMESIEKLREALKDCTSVSGIEPNEFDTYWITAAACDKLIDAIEREIAERYMELPLDADGVPIHIGDCMLVRTTKAYVRAIGDGYWIDDTEGFTHTPEDWSHYKPRTIEDVLKDCAESWECVSDANKADLLAKYADELRSMGVDA